MCLNINIGTIDQDNYDPIVSNINLKEFLRSETSVAITKVNNVHMLSN